jgi:hypothetical protein
MKTRLNKEELASMMTCGRLISYLDILTRLTRQQHEQS